jgi:hypothetical protein
MLTMNNVKSILVQELSKIVFPLVSYLPQHVVIIYKSFYTIQATMIESSAFKRAFI